MNRRDLFGQVEIVEEQIGALYKQIAQMKLQIKSLIEENHRLTLENKHMRELVLEKKQKEEQKSTLESEVKQNKSKVIGEGHDTLARLYYEGFHICNQEYGALRTEGDCLFCLSFLNKQDR